jgi:hypothetical protein
MAASFSWQLAGAVGLGLLLLAIATALQASRLVPAPFDVEASHVLALTTAIAVTVVVIAAAAAGLRVVWLTSRPAAEQTPPAGEEPFLPAPNVPASRVLMPLICLAALERGAGASTLTFNLAVVIALEGLVKKGTLIRCARPLCLLSEGPLAHKLGLSSEPMHQHLTRNTGRICEDLVGAAYRHPSGCELLCLPAGGVGRHQLRLLRDALSRHYDAVLVDCRAGDLILREGALDVANVLLQVGLPTERSLDSAVALLDEVGPVRRRDGPQSLLINQVRSSRDMLLDILAELGNLSLLPFEPEIAKADRNGLPWSLRSEGASARLLGEMARQLSPQLFMDRREDLVLA